MSGKFQTRGRHHLPILVVQGRMERSFTREASKSKNDIRELGGGMDAERHKETTSQLPDKQHSRRTLRLVLGFSDAMGSHCIMAW